MGHILCRPTAHGRLSCALLSENRVDGGGSSWVLCDCQVQQLPVCFRLLELVLKATFSLSLITLFLFPLFFFFFFFNLSVPSA